MNIKYVLLIAAALPFTQTATAQTGATKQTVLNQSGAAKSPQVTKSAGSKKYVCEAAKQDLASLDSMATQLNNSAVQEQVKERKTAIRKIVYEWEC